MLALHPEFIIDKNEKKKSVVLPFLEWKKILEIIEEIDDIRAFDIAKNDKEESISFEQAIKEIKNGTIK
ncbi:MAG: hypothetical protein K8S23_03140 [Candidatus Cloacimonetes bacterium]|nr:hypothetical protein [Candidatus Cloacimonadota bacterium]